MSRSKLAAVVVFGGALLLLPAAGPLAAGGALDPSFGSSGTTLLVSASANAVGVAPDGKLVFVAGDSDAFAVFRLNADGSPDLTFDGDGRVVVDVTGGYDEATAVAFGAGGSIVVAGNADANYGVIRLNDDGSLDSAFDDDGRAVVDLGGFDLVNGVVVDSLGRVVVGGQSDFGGGGLSDFGLVRMSASGTLDPTFDGDGIVRTDLTGSRDDLFALALQPDGKLVAGGPVIVAGGFDFGAARYLDTGALDPAFGGGDGLVTVDFGGNDTLWGLGVGPGGTIGLGGYTGTTCCANNFVAARLLADGTLDPAFGGDGKADPVDLGGNDIGFDAVIDSSGRIVVTGSREAGGDFDWGTVRYAADGTLDTTFGTGGIAPSPFTVGFARAFGAALQPDGKLVVVGLAEDGASSGAGVARYLSDSAAPNGAPTATFTVTPSSGTTATTFSFDGGGSTDPDGDALTYAWAFGDGGTGSGAATTYAYAAAGSYTAKLTVSDGRGGSGSTTRAVTVTAPPPANLIVDDDRAQCPSAAHTTIQSAVDAAAPGATVTVCAGSYGGVTVAKQLTLRGPSADASRAAACGSAVVGAATDAIVSGGTITLAASGIDLRGFVIKDATTGLVTDAAGSGYTVANNLFEGSTDGMHFASSGASPSVASGNCFRRHSRAAIFSIAVPVKNVEIVDNAFVDNGNNGGDGWAMAMGEFRFGDSLIWVENVTIARNSSSGDNRFIEIPGSRDVVIEENESAGTATSVFLANNNIGTRVRDNSFADGQTGIYVSSIGPFGGLPNSDLVISGNSVTGMSGAGIATEAGASMLSSTVSGNTSSGNPNGIWLAGGSTGNTISGNTLTGNLTYDCRDDTTGTGTAGTANTWSSNTAATESRLGLCVVPNRAPTASFTVTPESGTTATSFSFDGTGSGDPDGDALTYAWAFGDGDTGSGATRTHTYAEPGTHTVTLTVSDGRGGSDSTTRSVTVTAPDAGSPSPPGNRAPNATFEVTAAPAGGASTFDAAGSSDPDGDPLAFSWSFGDGGSATGSAVSHVYAAAGTYTVQLTVADGRGGSASATRAVVVSEPGRSVLSVRKVGRGRGVVRADGGVNCGTACSATYRDGSAVVLQAVPARGFTFRGWGGSCAGAGSTCRLTVAAATFVTARFEPRRPTDPYSLVVEPQGGGSVATWEWGLSGAPIDCGRICADQFRRGSFVRLVAVPKLGFRFAGWTGACAGQGSWCRLEMSASRSTSPRFLPKPVTLTVTKSGEGTVATWEWGLDERPVDCGRACSRTFQEGAEVRLTAVAAPGFEFSGWTGACAGQGAWCSLVLAGPRETHAIFVISSGTSR